MPRPSPRKKTAARTPAMTPETYHLLVEHAPSAVVLADAEGTIILVNKKTEELFGYSRDEMLGKPVELLLPESARERHRGYRHGYMTAPEARDMGAGRDLHGRRKDGREVPVEIGLNPIPAPQGMHILAAIVDITERKRLEERLAQSEALAAVGSMAAILAHEIRNPLGSIVMAARSLDHGDLTPEDRKTVSNVLTEESQRLNRTLQDFLLFARPRPPKLERADLNQLAEETAAALRSDAQLLGAATLELALDPALPPFPHDADQVRQVLWNLLLNGVQAMGGRGRLRLSTAAESGRAVLRVDDSGPGIDPSMLERIFDPFFTTKKKGTGLGLAICRRIALAHGGAMSADEAPSGGARFTLSLPLAPKR